MEVGFEGELARVLPADIPHRERLIEKAARHLQMIVAANEHMNLTRITSPHEAAIKHVYDSLAPWRYFQTVGRVLDAGTGAGFPGIPLSLVLPEVHFVLSESVGKKARFVESVAESLDLDNVQVVCERAESIAITQHSAVITARAMAPISRIIDLFSRPLKAGAKILLYKGPDVISELREAKWDRVRAEVLYRYDLPDNLGSRTLVELRAQPRWMRTAS